MFTNKKIAFIYDWIDKWGGVERVLLTLHEAFPQAHFISSYINKEKTNWAKNLDISTTFIQKLPDCIKNNRIVSIPFYPYAFESINLSKYDIVISITSSFAKAIITKPSTYHLCYLLTPTRFLWSHAQEYIQSPLLKLLINPYIQFVKEWDLVASQRPDDIVSISNTVALRCKHFYGRDSKVIYPPFDLDYWRKIKNNVHQSKSIKKKFNINNYFLVVSRLESYKKIDLVIQAFNRMKEKKVVIVGTGTLEKKLHSIAGPNILFIPYVSDEELGELYDGAQALIMSQEEDFGYVSLEAQFFDCPVIAFNKGGVRETTIQNKTSILFDRQNIGSIIQTIEEFHTISYNVKVYLKKNSEIFCAKFSKNIFISSITNFIKNKIEQRI